MARAHPPLVLMAHSYPPLVTHSYIYAYTQYSSTPPQWQRAAQQGRLAS